MSFVSEKLLYSLLFVMRHWEHFRLGLFIVYRRREGVPCPSYRACLLRDWEIHLFLSVVPILKLVARFALLSYYAFCFTCSVDLHFDWNSFQRSSVLDSITWNRIPNLRFKILDMLCFRLMPYRVFPIPDLHWCDEIFSMHVVFLS